MFLDFTDFKSHIIFLVLNTFQCHYIPNKYPSSDAISFDHNLMFFTISLHILLFWVNSILKKMVVVYLR